LFLAYVNDIWKNIEATIRLFAGGCIIYRKIFSNDEVENLQINPNRLREWVLENEMKINPAKSKAICFTKARVPESPNDSLGDIIILKAYSCKYLGNILGRD
jgi:hypothetical protein